MPTAEIVLGVAEAALGAVEVIQGLVSESNGGFHITADGGSYPKELNGFLKQGTMVNREVIKFVADGYIWDTDLGISMRGSFSHNNDDLMCYEDIPWLPSNRFMTDVRFFESAHSDSVSKSELT